MAFLMAADIVITNPPFSLFREYIKQLMEYNKKFIVLGNMNAITYKEVFPLIKENKLWLGCSSFNNGMYFKVPDTYEYADTYKFEREIDGVKVMRVAGICWFSNLEHKKRHYKMDLYKLWSRCAAEYPKYDNYDAIEVSKTCDIPLGYKGVLGVPITFLDKYCPDQFEIVGIMTGADGESFVQGNNGKPKFTVSGKEVYARILIRFRDGEGEEPDLTKDWR